MFLCLSLEIPSVSYYDFVVRNFANLFCFYNLFSLKFLKGVVTKMVLIALKLNLRIF